MMYFTSWSKIAFSQHNFSNSYFPWRTQMAQSLKCRYAEKLEEEWICLHHMSNSQTWQSWYKGSMLQQLKLFSWINSRIVVSSSFGSMSRATVVTPSTWIFCISFCCFKQTGHQTANVSISTGPSNSDKVKLFPVSTSFNWMSKILTDLQYRTYNNSKNQFILIFLQIVLENLYHDEVWYHVGSGYFAGPIFVTTAVIGHVTSIRNTRVW